MPAATALKRISLLLPLLLLALQGCTPRAPIAPGTVPAYRPVTDEDEAYGRQVFQQLHQQYPLDVRPGPNERVRRVVARLGEAAQAGDAPWRVYVFRADSVKNAAATQGNYIFVWSGILDFARSDDELATVLAHEIGHVLADHTRRTPAETASQILVGAGGLAAQSALASQGYAGLAVNLAGQAVQSILQAAVINPEEQRKELEADHIGLFLLARAGYDPRAAVDFWQRLSTSGGIDGGGLAFLSTHPPTKRRLEERSARLPRAEDVYARRTPSAVPFDAAGDPRPPAQGGGQPQGRIAPVRPPSGRPLESWIVAEEAVPVYARPDNRSPRLYTLRRGTRVGTTGVEGRWLRITEPVHGYARSRELAPE